MSLPRRPEAVIFDMDGLLVDTEVFHREAMIAAVQATGQDMSISLYLTTIGMPGEASRKILEDNYGDTIDVGAVWDDATRRFQEMVQTRRYMKAGVQELLDALDEIEMPRAIATSSRHQTVRHHLSMHDLQDRFDSIVAQGDYVHGKPKPDPFLLAAKRLDVAPERCLALEDSHNGVRAATQAGMMTIMVPDLLHPTEEMHRLCIRIADDLHEVRDLIETVV
ncbi:MAG: HAD family phosphatase [Pseudomonadota bacterium]